MDQQALIDGRVKALRTFCIEVRKIVKVVEKDLDDKKSHEHNFIDLWPEFRTALPVGCQIVMSNLVSELVKLEPPPPRIIIPTRNNNGF